MVTVRVKWIYEKYIFCRKKKEAIEQEKLEQIAEDKRIEALKG